MSLNYCLIAVTDQQVQGLIGVFAWLVLHVRHLNTNQFVTGGPGTVRAMYLCYTMQAALKTMTCL